MPTRYEFGFGYGEIYRRRMQRGAEMWRQRQRWERELPPEERRPYESDYFGLRGSGSRGGREVESRARSRSGSRSRPSRGSARRSSGSRRRGR